MNLLRNANGTLRVFHYDNGQAEFRNLGQSVFKSQSERKL